MFKTIYRKIRNAVLTVLILIYLVLDELIWERIAEPIYQFIHGLKVLQQVERILQQQNRYVILSFYLLLFAIVEGLGIVAIALFTEGQVLIATVVYVSKVPIAAFTFWVFRITQDKLMTFVWFKWCYDGLQALLLKIKSSTVYLNIKTRLHNVKAWVKGLFASPLIHRLRSILGFKSPYS